jgi:hypothetical protein
MTVDYLNRNIIFFTLFRGEDVSVDGNRISYKPRNSWLAKEIDKLEKSGKIDYNIYYFNSESSTLDENDIMTLTFHLDVPKGGSEKNSEVKKRILDTKNLIYDKKGGGILKEGVYIKGGEWDDFDYVMEPVTSATIKLTGKFVGY